MVAFFENLISFDHSCRFRSQYYAFTATGNLQQLELSSSTVVVRTVHLCIFQWTANGKLYTHVDVLTFVYTTRQLWRRRTASAFRPQVAYRSNRSIFRRIFCASCTDGSPERTASYRFAFITPAATFTTLTTVGFSDVRGKKNWTALLKIKREKIVIFPIIFFVATLLKFHIFHIAW